MVGAEIIMMEAAPSSRFSGGRFRRASVVDGGGVFGESVLRLTDVFMLCYSESCSGVVRLTTRHLCHVHWEGFFSACMRCLGSDRSDTFSVVAK
jgi:hypothetical protein